MTWPERTLVTDSQRLLTPLKWRLSCVMRQAVAADGSIAREWRLINGRALYDLRADPEQRSDVAAQHPDVVARLRADYESWWEQVSGRFDEPIPIPIGETDNDVLLTSHDWRRDPGEERVTDIDAYADDARCVWNQAQVRAGPALTGYWEVEVARSGRYRVETRRWPREAALALDGGIAGSLKGYTDAIAPWNGGYGGGTAIPITRATLRAGSLEVSHETAPGAESAVFDVSLPAGVTRMEAIFTTTDGATTGAYYAYVTLVDRR